MNIAYLALGSNQYNPERQLRRAIQAIQALQQTVVTKTSSFHWTPAWGLQSQQIFCNAVIEIKTRLQPRLLLEKCNFIEEQQGRIRTKKWGPRIIDIDIVLYADRKIATKTLTIPHPHMHERDFVLKPLSEVFPALQQINQKVLLSEDLLHLT